MYQCNTAGCWAHPRSIFVVLNQLSPASFKVHTIPSGEGIHQQHMVACRPPHQWCISCARSDCGRKAEAWRGLTLNPNDAAAMLAAGKSAEKGDWLGAICKWAGYALKSGAPLNPAASSEVSGRLVATWMCSVLLALKGSSYSRMQSQN